MRLRFLGCSLLLWFTAAIAPANDAARAELLRDVERLPRPGVPSSLCVWGERGFGVVPGAGVGASEAVVAATVTASGARIVALGHPGFFAPPAIDSVDMPRLLDNAVRWCSGSDGTTNTLTIVAPDPVLRQWLSTRGYRTAPGGWETLAEADVLFLTHDQLSEERVAQISNAIGTRRLGIVAAGIGWGWQQLNPTKDLPTQYPLNRLLAPHGLAWTNRYMDATAPENTFAATPDPLPLLDGNRALQAILEFSADRTMLTAAELAQASAMLELAVEAIPPGDVLLLPELFSSLEDEAAALLPAPDKPLSQREPLARLALLRAVSTAETAPADSLPAHPSAAAFPGSVPKEAPRIAKSVTIAPSRPRWHSTGLYAPPGETIAIEVPQEIVHAGLRVRIGAHTDDIGAHREWRRAPRISREFPVDTEKTTVANAFGGLIYLDATTPLQTTASIAIVGAVEAPRFVLDETSREDWRARIRHAPAPWGELETSKLIITLPSHILAALDDPTPVLRTWDRVLDAQADLAQRPRARAYPERIVADVQISVGYMHAGYPIMVQDDQYAILADNDAILEGQWGLLHELGHNHQEGDWTFEGTGEVTVNLFTLYTLETVCRPEAMTRGHAVLAEQERLLQPYLDDGAPFDRWQRDPFLALLTYRQLREEFGWEPFKAVFREYRTLHPNERPQTESEKMEQWALRFSRAVGRDLVPFFRKWGWPIREELSASLSGLPRWMPKEMAP